MSGFNYSGGSVADSGHESFDFDNIANRALDHCRKWDAGIVRGKYPDTPDVFIPMWIADMDFAAAPCIRAALRELSENGAYGYTYPYREFADSIVGWQSRRGSQAGMGQEYLWYSSDNSLSLSGVLSAERQGDSQYAGL